MTGNKGFTIVVVALLITLCFGFLANVEETPSTRTVYNDQVNLEPLFYANSARGSSVELYNSIYNVTGWNNADVPETDIANQYRLPSIDTYVNNSPVSYDLDTFTHTTGGYKQTSPGGWRTSVNDVYYVNGGETYTNGEPITGGFGGTYEFTVAGNTYIGGMGYKLNNVTIDNNEQIAFVELSRLITLTDKIKVTNDGYYFNVDINEVRTSEQLPFNRYLSTQSININGQLNIDCAYMIYDNTFTRWNLYDSSDNQIGTSNNVYIIKTGTFTGTITSARLETALPRFANPNELVSIGAAETPADMAQWSNTIRSETLINARVGVLVTGNLDIRINANDTASIEVRNQLGAYSVTAIETYAIGTYDGLYIVFDALADLITVYGVLSFSDTAPALSYELTPFTYDISYNYASEEITALYFDGVISGNAYIANTWVYSDPLGILWYNFDLNLSDYFSDRIYQNEGVRVTINGTTYYGESLTINNRQFSIESNRIEYSWIDGGTIYVQYKPLNGLIIDYIDNHAIVRYADGTVLYWYDKQL